MKLLAHIRDNGDLKIEQTLKDHCFQVAKYAEDCVSGTGLENTAYLSGLLHDMGKAKKSFMDYIEASYQGKEVHRGSVNHTFAGVIYILEKYHDIKNDKMVVLASEMISCAIGGHHGIYDCTDLEGNSGFIHRLHKDKKEIDYNESVYNYFAEVVDEATINELFYKSVEEVENLFQKLSLQSGGNANSVWFQIGTCVRLLQSSVIYGDRRDTREFMSGANRTTDILPDWDSQVKFFEEKMEGFLQDTEINKVRTAISNRCLDSSEKPCGIYRLDVPTGSGKTLSTLRYALNHAKKYKKKRIIFIIPLLSVLDQNSQVISNYISDSNMILEHHSNVIQEHEDAESLDPYEVLIEDWHSPIIISTLVQFLNILFKDKTSAIQRMQALCDSIIVFDEVQSLPLKATAMFNMTMNFISQFCHTTVVLSSATLPCLDTLGPEVKNWSMKLTEDADLVHLSEDELAVFRRTEIINCITPYGMTTEECIDFSGERIQENSSVLLICNTKKEARILYEGIQEIAEDNWQVYHLSTSMCQAHRVNTLKEIQKGLTILQGKKGEKEKIVCISTQLVEAGIDLSFECVIRVLAGIDNLAQAAGRCNRSNEYHCGKVYLVKLKDENLGMLEEISRAQDSTLKLLEVSTDFQDEQLIGTDAAREYYKILYRYAGKELKYPIKDFRNTQYMADMLANKNEFVKDKSFVLRQPFKTMGKMFQTFEDDTVDILVPYAEGRQIIDRLKLTEMDPLSSIELEGILKQARRYSINIFDYQKIKLEENGLLSSICDGRILILQESAYSNAYGLGDISESKVEDFIV